MADPVPHDIRQLADERARARRARDWTTADRLKAELEREGWRVVDAGTLYSLERLPPPVVEVDGMFRYGASAAVPSRLDEPALSGCTFVLVADDVGGLLPRAVAAVMAHCAAAQVVVVANAPSPEVTAEVAAVAAGVDVVWLAPRLGVAAAWNAGLRRVSSEIAAVLDVRVGVRGDAAAAFTAALEDAEVAVAGLRGLVTTDLVRFEPALPGAATADAVDRLGIAFRRADLIARGPLDEHFATGDYLDVWWSLMLRDVDETAGVEAAPRRAAVVETPFALLGEVAAPADERLAKKARYRFLRYFATRRDLLGGPGGVGEPRRGARSREIPRAQPITKP